MLILPLKTTFLLLFNYTMKQWCTIQATQAAVTKFLLRSFYND
ncbi:hypothetical protein HMPREF0494_1891 [Limosilactobacillus antri DSM 16041]|uniref:Uncharacterized protein n=1 Tax=Limosilactobacillus antri DSM 16041 TaxID=525309 RepID=C8P997_9LACO|nr:hypothetical protein HMPREF0494_1891 [Limosilactobacillus antri DSM 16041]